MLQTKLDHKPTEEQEAILDAVSSSRAHLMIRARAGCGKTATLKMIDSLAGPVPYLLICFNKSVADEARQEVRTVTTVKTFNSLGAAIWNDYIHKRAALNKNKIRDIFKNLTDAAPRYERNELWKMYDIVMQGVNLARAIGYIPPSHAKAKNSLADYERLKDLLDETPVPEAHALIDKVLNLCIAQSYAGTIDFNDQIYMPALFGGNFPQFPVVLVDEYQDLSPVNRAMVTKLCRHSRQIGVGDEAQAIYAFRGADEDSMPTAIAEFSMEVLPLSLSFRCPSNITQNVHWHVPDIRSVMVGGDVSNSTNIEVRPSTAVICRYNAPLCHLAMQQLLAGRKVNMSGVDIGNRIIRQLSKLGSEELPQYLLLDRIAQWQDERESLDSKTAVDMADCMRVFATKGKTLGQAIAYATHLFTSSTGEIEFLSGHRAKGLEFDHVYHLNSHRIDRSRGQEANIHYVCDTRPSQTLTYISE